MKIGSTERGDAYVHFDEWSKKLHTVDGAILITKDPLGLYELINKFDYNKCIFHCTVTGWAGTPIEPKVPDIGTAMIGYSRLLAKFGSDKVVLRVDPIIPTPEGISRALAVYSHRGGRTRISFLDMYEHVRARLKQVAPKILSEWDFCHGHNKHASLKDREAIKTAEFSEAEVCGEPGMSCSGCVSLTDLNVLDLPSTTVNKSLQRTSCCCLANKVELLSNRKQCEHSCAYCYWR